ncbi:hypothetical protein BDW22DRAFT_1350638 [Trametopsis cervina]|nr:hypothetical protein BDW22DRAFT_1350638 [Trametopsis cervina]
MRSIQSWNENQTCRTWRDSFLWLSGWIVFAAGESHAERSVGCGRELSVRADETFEGHTGRHSLRITAGVSAKHFTPKRFELPSFSCLNSGPVLSAIGSSQKKSMDAEDVTKQQHFCPPPARLAGSVS